MEKPEEGDLKAKEDREKFESITKVETTPVITRGSRGSRKLIPGVLKSPDEQNSKWVPDPEDLIAARRAARKERRDLKS